MKTKMKQKIKRKCNAMTSMKGKNVTYNKIIFLASLSSRHKGKTDNADVIKINI